MIKLREPSAAEGLSQLLRLLTRSALFFGQYLPSWLPRWDTEDGKQDNVIQRWQRGAQGGSGVEITASAWHPDRNFLALAVWKRSSNGQVRYRPSIFISRFDAL